MEEMNGNPIDILLVEDNEDDAEITLMAFAKAKLKNNVYVASDGMEALDFLNHKGKYEDVEKYPRPDLILLDINMPKIGGFEFLERIKSDDKFNIIPVAMLTSSQDENDIVRSYKNGAVSYIQKPVDYDNFMKVIEGFNFYWHIVNKLPDATS